MSLDAADGTARDLVEEILGKGGTSSYHLVRDVQFPAKLRAMGLPVTDAQVAEGWPVPIWMLSVVDPDPAMEWLGNRTPIDGVPRGSLEPRERPELPLTLPSSGR